MAKRFIAKKTYIGAITLISLTGCSTINNILEPNKIDYRSASKTTVASLEVPPDLTQIRRDSRFAIPDANKSTATASGYNLGKTASGVKESNLVAPKQMAGMRIERLGNQRWLVVSDTPEKVWPKIKDFWLELGFLINTENPETGVMETDWAENRAKIPQDIVRSTLGKVFDSLYSTGERDKFRTRIERGNNGEIEIFISHRGAQEVLTGSQKESIVWTPRPSDPELEAEIISRLMIALGSDPAAAKVAVTSGAVANQSAPAQPQALGNLVVTSDVAYLDMPEGFDKSWRKIGLALDRVGFTVEDRDRSQGIYYVRYVDQDTDAQNKEKGFFARLFSWGSSDLPKTNQKYRIYVKAQKSNTERSVVTVHGEDGSADKSQTAQKILKLFNDQLKQ